MLDVKLSGLKNAINKVHVVADLHRSRLLKAKLASLAVNEVKGNIRAGKNASGGPQRPSRRFGRDVPTPLIFKRELLNSVRANVTTGGIRIVSDAKHARVQNDGATITPRSKKYLIVPFHRHVWEALRRESARTAFPNARIAKINGKLFLKQGKTFLGILKRAVVLPPRPFAGLSFDQRLKIGRALDREYTRAWKEGE